MYDFVHPENDSFDAIATPLMATAHPALEEPFAGRLLDGFESVREREHYGEGFKPASRSTAESSSGIPGQCRWTALLPACQSSRGDARPTVMLVVFTAQKFFVTFRPLPDMSRYERFT